MFLFTVSLHATLAFGIVLDVSFINKQKWPGFISQDISDLLEVFNFLTLGLGIAAVTLWLFGLHMVFNLALNNKT